MRNTGGSIGIAVMTTMLARNSQVHQNVLAGNTNVYNPAFQQYVHQISAGFAGMLDPASATQAAYASIYGMMGRQAAVLAYIDDFRILAVLCLLCIPAGFLFKAVRHAKPIEGAH
jgi:DHA2 family multidrug resistance protein